MKKYLLSLVLFLFSITVFGQAVRYTPLRVENENVPFSTKVFYKDHVFDRTTERTYELTDNFQITDSLITAIRLKKCRIIGEARDVRSIATMVIDSVNLKDSAFTICYSTGFRIDTVIFKISSKVSCTATPQLYFGVNTTKPGVEIITTPQTVSIKGIPSKVYAFSSDTIPSTTTLWLKFKGTVSFKTFFVEILGHKVSGGTVPIQYEPESEALFAKMTVQPSTSTKILINNLISGLITDTIWQQMDVMQIYALETSQQSSLNWIHPDTNNAKFINNPTFTPNLGIKGNGSSSYINTMFMPSSDHINFTQNAASFIVKIQDNETTNGQSGVGAPYYTFLYPNFNGNCYGSVNYSSYDGVSFPVTGSQGWRGFVRTNSTTIKGWYNKTKTTSTGKTSTGYAIQNLFIGALSNGGTPVNFNNCRYSYFSVGGILTDTQMSKLQDKVDAFLTAIAVFDSSSAMYSVPAITTTVTSGARIKRVIPGTNSNVYYVIQFPENYNPATKYPIVFTLPGNAYMGKSGLPDDSQIGTGVCGNLPVLNVVCPFLNHDGTAITPSWWGNGDMDDISSTITYIYKVITDAGTTYNGDTTKIVAAGFSRGAIALGKLLCSDVSIVAKFNGFFAHAWMDGGSLTPTGADVRLGRSNGKSWYITWGQNDGAAKDGSLAGLAIIQAAGITESHAEIANISHEDTWTLYKYRSEITQVRNWLRNLLGI